MSSIKKYIVKLKPIGSWFFGSERNMGFGRDYIRIAYFVNSKLYPSQTTCLGVIRYLLQKQLLGLNDDFSIDENLIGKKSFDMDSNCQDFGVIKEIGSIFVLDSNENIYIPSPMNLRYKEESKSSYYEPYILKKYDLGFEEDEYVFEDFRAKEFRPYDKFLKISKDEEENLKVISQDDIFVGKNKNRTNKSIKEDSFFKQRIYTFKNDPDEYGKSFYFAFTLILDCEKGDLDIGLKNKFKAQGLKEDVVMIGNLKSSFNIRFEELTDEFSLEKRIQSALETKKFFSDNLDDVHLYYVASDTYVKDDIYSKIFSVTKTEFFKNIKTNYPKKLVVDKDEENEFKSDYYGDTLKNIITAGSVIYVRGEDILKDFNEKNKNLQKIGMNNLIKISKEN